MAGSYEPGERVDLGYDGGKTVPMQAGEVTLEELVLRSGEGKPGVYDQGGGHVAPPHLRPPGTATVGTEFEDVKEPGVGAGDSHHVTEAR